MQHLRLVVATPSGPDVKVDYMCCLTAMFADLRDKPVPGFASTSARFISTKGSILPQQRHLQVQTAMHLDATHILWIDSDQVFPPDTARKLLASGRRIIGCNVATKQLPARSTARTFDGEKFVPVYTTKDSMGVQEVARVGFGVLLVDCDIFRKVPPPYFGTEWRGPVDFKGDWWNELDPAKDCYEGEDWYFCGRMAEAGYKVHIMHSLSKKIGHVGQFVYTHDHVEIVNDAQ